MIIFLLSGYAGSGKDTFADILIQMFESKGKSYKKYAFADEVKKDISNIYKDSLSSESLLTQEGKAKLIETTEGVKTARQLLIEHSANMKKVHGDNYWAQIVCSQIDSSIDIHIISDWRYDIEYETIHSYFHSELIITVRINRPYISVSSDPSEHELDYKIFDYVVKNYSDLENLKMKANHLLELLNI